MPWMFSLDTCSCFTFLDDFTDSKDAYEGSRFEDSAPFPIYFWINSKIWTYLIANKSFCNDLNVLYWCLVTFLVFGKGLTGSCHKVTGSKLVSLFPKFFNKFKDMGLLDNKQVFLLCIAHFLLPLGDIFFWRVLQIHRTRVQVQR